VGSAWVARRRFRTFRTTLFKVRAVGWLGIGDRFSHDHHGPVPAANPASFGFQVFGNRHLALDCLHLGSIVQRTKPDHVGDYIADPVASLAIVTEGIAVHAALNFANQV
jgi:hypothetical protein